jgi:hypothetical protein
MARIIDVTFSIGDPTANASKKYLDAPLAAREGKATAAQHEQKGCEMENAAPSREPRAPVLRRKELMYRGRAVNARPARRIPRNVACQTVSK